MKKILLSATSFFAMTIFVLCFQTSCKKETITNTVTKTDTVFQCAKTINGLWVGTYSVNSNPSQGLLFYSLSVYPDGSLLYKTKGGDGNFYYAKGTWTLSSSNIFSATLTSFSTPTVTQNITATYTNSGTLINGAWSDISGGSNSGNLQNLVKTY